MKPICYRPFETRAAVFSWSEISGMPLRESLNKVGPEKMEYIYFGPSKNGVHLFWSLKKSSTFILVPRKIEHICFEPSKNGVHFLSTLDIDKIGFI